MSLHEAPHALQRHRQLVARRAVGAAHEALACLTEGAAGDDGHLLLEEQLFGELVRAEAGARDGWEGVERALWLVGGQADGVQPGDEELAPLVVACYHTLDIRLAVQQR